MPNEIGKLNLDYVECGKLFYFQQNTSDFVLLDTSDRQIGSLVNREIYQPLIANYAAKYNLRFSGKPGEFGNFTVVLQSSKLFPNELLFIQIQQRTELDYLYRQQNVMPRTDLPNRPYTQAHISLIPARILHTCLQNDIDLYDSLLCRNINGLALKDYGALDPSGRQVLPQVLARPTIPNPFVLHSQDLPIVKGITNTLYDIFMQRDATRNDISMLLPNVVVVAPGLAMDRRLAIMQAVQKQLLPVFGILTFALDYAIPPESQLYFCERLPDDAFPIGKSITFTIDNVLSVAEKSQGFYQKAAKEGLSRLSDPIAMAFFRKRVSVDDALVITDTLKSETVSDDQKVISAILRNMSSLDSENKEKLVRILTKTSNHLLSFVEQISNYNLRQEEQLGLYQLAMIEPLRKLPEGLDLFMKVYLLIRREFNDFVQFRPILQRIMTTQPTSSLVRIKNSEQAELLYELLELCYRQPIRMSDSGDLLRWVFSQPTNALFQAIKSFKQDGKWNDLHQQELTYALANAETLWTEADVQRLFDSTALKIDDLKRLQLIYFLDSDKKIAELKNLPDAFKAEKLSKMIKSALGQQQDVFQVINKNQYEKARKVALSACNTQSPENFKFTQEWLGKIGSTTMLDDHAFWQDYETICRNFNQSQPLVLETHEDQALYDLLKAKINFEKDSIKDVCSAINCQKRHMVILAGMLSDKQGIPISDIKSIIDKLPETNSLAAAVVRLANESTKFMQSLMILEEKYCMKWLTVTQDPNLRNMYIDDDQQDLLHKSLFGISSASQEFLLHLLTNEPGMKKGVTDWSSYTQKVERLIQSRLANENKNQFTKNFFEIVRDFPGAGLDPWKYAKKIGILSQLLTSETATDRLPELTIISDLLETTETTVALQQNSHFSEGFTVLLLKIASKVSSDRLAKEYHPYLLYCCSDYLAKHSPQNGKINNFYHASESVFPDGLAGIV